MRTAHAPPTAASVAILANVPAMPTSRGAVLRVNGCPARANTNGRTGRMHGLTIVNAPPRKAKTAMIISVSVSLAGLETHFDVHAHLHRLTILHGRAEPPLLQRANRILIQFPGKRSNNPDNLRNAVFLDYRVEYDSSGARM